MKKTAAILLALCLLAGMLTACTAETNTQHSGKIRVVATIFPVYDWLREIADGSDGVELTLLLENGVDMHSYQPNAQDLIRISECDLFVFVGGTSDAWVGDVLSSTENPDRTVVNLLETRSIAVKEEQTVEGMQTHEEEEEGTEVDEHVWLSVRNAAALCKVLAYKLGEIDPKNAALYARNMQAYTAKLNALDAKYQAAADAGRVRTLLFADRFPFRYMADDYGLAYYAAFVGCSAETEASFRTILFLAEKADELGLHSILQIESADGSMAQTVRENTGTQDQQILTMNSLQSVTAKEIGDGTTYLSIMTDNLETLKTALQ